MMNIMVSTEEAQKGFYPTPADVAEKMLAGVDWKKVQTVLEPSAGKGNLILAVGKAYRAATWSDYNSLDVDAIELDPYLRQICKYEFSEENAEKYREIERSLEERYDSENRCYIKLTEEERLRKRWAEEERRCRHAVNLHMVHDDFLTYRTYKRYDLIVMNPPFADGDKHLLKALDMQKNGGAVICLLNAETLRNPYSSTRMVLKNKLAELNADIEFVEDAFLSSERSTDVEIAIVKVCIPEKVYESTIYERMKKAKENEAFIPDPELNQLVSGGWIEQQVSFYETEVAATMELVREYKALVPYIAASFEESSYNSNIPIISLAVNGERNFSVSEYIKAVRLKYWRALFNNPQFTEKLTSNLLETYRENINRMADYEFSVFNIKQVICEMNASLHEGLKETILKLFEKLTSENTYFEGSANVHYFNGWKTNKAHKITKKAIIPTYDVWRWDGKELYDYKVFALLSDIEKALDYLKGERVIDRRNLESFVKAACRCGQTKNIETTYFLVDFFKKGTCHIKFRPEAMPLIERLNIIAAKNRNWLPPSYGTKAYSAMDAEEKAVIDSFHGDDSDGSGEAEYNKVMAERDYYLTSPAKETLMLGA